MHLYIHLHCKPFYYRYEPFILVILAISKPPLDQLNIFIQQCMRFSLSKIIIIIYY